jgi:hypothetical protein
MREPLAISDVISVSRRSAERLFLVVLVLAVLTNVLAFQKASGLSPALSLPVAAFLIGLATGVLLVSTTALVFLHKRSRTRFQTQ